MKKVNKVEDEKPSIELDYTGIVKKLGDSVRNVFKEIF